MKNGSFGITQRTDLTRHKISYRAQRRAWLREKVSSYAEQEHKPGRR
jgi:hypothetical protein